MMCRPPRNDSSGMESLRSSVRACHGVRVSAIQVRRAHAADAQAIGAVFDAAVRAGWTYLGELVDRPMFTPADWDRLVADHAVPNVLLVATDEQGNVVGYTAAHPEDGELWRDAA
jgi:hypothetical protein